MDSKENEDSKFLVPTNIDRNVGNMCKKLRNSRRCHAERLLKKSHLTPLKKRSTNQNSINEELIEKTKNFEVLKNFYTYLIFFRRICKILLLWI